MIAARGMPDAEREIRSVAQRKLCAQREVIHVCNVLHTGSSRGLKVFRFGGVPHERTREFLCSQGFRVSINQQGWTSRWYITL